jgi:tetratricopeptide (TPR) repeat protein
MQSGKTEDAESYFAKAVEADPQFAPAYLNLGRVLLLAKDYVGAEALVDRATTLDPTSSETLSLLAYVQFLREKFDSAIATAHRVHMMNHERFAMVHFVAANAYERKHLQQEAMFEYQQYIQEAPHGPSAERARSKLTVLQAAAR